MELSAEIVVDLRATGMRVRLDSDEHAEAVSAAARDLGLAANPAVLQHLSVVFESAGPAMVRRSGSACSTTRLGRTAVWRIRCGATRDTDPAVDGAAALRNRIHLDVVRRPPAVEQASLGEASGPFGVCHTDPDGNEVDLVPGEALGERIGTADWQAVFSAMACYRTTSPTQQRDLAAAAAALADDTGFPVLVDLRPGLVIIDSGKDQWKTTPGLELRLHRPRRKPPDRCPRTRGHCGSGAAALRSAPPRHRRRRRSPRVLGRRTSDTPTTGERVIDIHDPRRLNPVVVFQELDALETERRGSATASTSSSRCRRTSRRRASPRPSQPVAGSLTSRRIAGRSPTPKATKW